MSNRKIADLEDAVDNLLLATLTLAAHDYSPYGATKPGARIAEFDAVKLACREVVRFVDAQPAERQPEGWGDSTAVDAARIMEGILSHLPNVPDVEPGVAVVDSCQGKLNAHRMVDGKLTVVQIYCGMQPVEGTDFCEICTPADTREASPVPLSIQDPANPDNPLMEY